MGNKTNRLSPTQFKNSRVHELIVWMATRDGEVCAREREAIVLSQEVSDDIAFDIGMDNLEAHLRKMRRDDEVTDYTNRLAEVVNLSIENVIDLEAEREARKLVPFPQRDEYA